MDESVKQFARQQAEKKAELEELLGFVRGAIQDGNESEDVTNARLDYLRAIATALMALCEMKLNGW